MPRNGCGSELGTERIKCTASPPPARPARPAQVPHRPPREVGIGWRWKWGPRGPRVTHVQEESTVRLYWLGNTTECNPNDTPRLYIAALGIRSFGFGLRFARRVCARSSQFSVQIILCGVRVRGKGGKKFAIAD